MEKAVTELSSFPVDDATLMTVLHSLDGALNYDALGDCSLIGSDMSFPQLLEFLSGPSDHTEYETDAGTVEIREDPAYSSDDVIRALILEIFELRGVSDNLD
ncbi:hypothetical protein PP301_gp102 [Gordonia phage GMA2]|uniref:Uncharacterized protein n=1 Tax=Gordonia phage GMA2 TaxID=1647283 RepID=A0A0K0N708_9CAUD|nr:hypothetical protein PP301_gp102 [Gordonia phage GMA2]AKJ72620.1 hypothetical protein GMA2_82 [Gordonia phage GMA2]